MPNKLTLYMKKTSLKLNRVVGHDSAKNHMSKRKMGQIASLADKGAQDETKNVYQQQEKKERKHEAQAEVQKGRQEKDKQLHATDDDSVATRYGDRPDDEMTTSHSLADIVEITKDTAVSFKARLHHIRPMSSKLVFLLLRSQADTIQGVLQAGEPEVSENFIRWASALHTESLVYVEGNLRKSQEPVATCSIHDREIALKKVYLLTGVDEALPLDPYHVGRVKEDEETNRRELAVPEHGRTANRLAYLRTPTMQSVLRISSAVCGVFRSRLDEQGFIEIHTPKIQPAATESGAEVFQLKYFGRTAFLAQSPQLAKQMAISADFGRVYEIGPVFRAENSNTHRHLTEYTGLDLEMVIDNHYHEALDLIDDLLKTIFRVVYERHRKEIEVVKKAFPHEDLVWLDKTPRLSFKEGVELLNSSGWLDNDGHQASEFEDLHTAQEVRLGDLVKEKYGADYYILDKFPQSARPFYTRLDPDDDRVTCSFDIFVRGQEIVTGGQRVNDPQILAEQMQEAGIDPEDMAEYMRAFEWGVPPHAGCGIGLERIVFLLLNLGDIRNATLFPRDPKSLPRKLQAIEFKLPHDDADTIRYAFEHERTKMPMPTLENLIANYGDATNTSWLDDRYTVWRDEVTGAAVGYAETKGYALIMGNPLCDTQQYSSVAAAFLQHLERSDLRPLWLLVSAELKDLFCSRLDWRAIMVVAEERVDPSASHTARASRMAKKERQAANAQLQIHETGLGEPVPDDVKTAIDERIKDWLDSRQGRSKQVHLTEVRPWVDMAHRRYVWAQDKAGTPVGLELILHKLAPRHGYQVKFALDFPGAPSGSIEVLVSRALASLAAAGVKTVTFGAGAQTVLRTENLGRCGSRIMQRTYKTIVEQLKLVQKSEFRQKFGAEPDEVYICYPKLGLGVSGARTLINFFEGEM